MGKIKIIPNYEKIERLFLTFPSMDNRKIIIQEFLNFIYTIAISLKKKIYVTIIYNKGEKEYIIEQLESYKDLSEYLYFHQYKEPFDLDFNKKNIIDSKLMIVDLFESSVMDIWTRDFAFIGQGILNGKNYLIKSTYYPRYALETCLIDDTCGRKICQEYAPNEDNEFITLPFILDGGNVVVNDDFIICTEELFIENYKNFSMQHIKECFENNFEQKLIILPKDPISPISHSDAIISFLDNKTVLLPSYPNSSEYRRDEKYISEVYKILKENLVFDTEYIFIPSDLSDEINDCVFSDAYNYVNFLQIENNIFMPSFDDGREYESEIYQIFKRKFPEINLHFIPCNNLAKAGGLLHCISNSIYKY